MFGDYRILAPAGNGGMGVVYQAVHVRLRRLVALKLLRADLSNDPGFEDRFLREAALAASIKRHKNVVLIYDSGVEDDRLFLAMEWVEGEDLRSILDRDGPLAPADAVAIVLQTASALEAVHATMVHRDVKPANIMVSGDGEARHVYLTDFGIARPTGRGETLTQEGVTIGTPGYLSPEQAMGRGVDLRADLYALGCVFFEAITGRPVFSATNDMALEWAHAHSTLPALVPVLGSPYEPFDRFLTTALAIDPDSRHSSASEFASALEAAAIECNATSGTSAVGGGSPNASVEPEQQASGARTRRARRMTQPIAFIALALVVMVGAAAGILAASGGVLGKGSSPSWQKPVNLGASAPLGSGPTAGVDASGNVYVFWEGTNGVLWQKWFFDQVWNGPNTVTAVGQGLASQPAVAVRAGGEQDVFWKGIDRHLRVISHTNKWQQPGILRSGSLGSSPTAGVDANGSEYVFWKGTDGALWDKWNVDGQWNGPNRISAAGNGLASPPAVAVHTDGQQDVFWKGTNGHLWEVSHSHGWQKAQDLGSGPLVSAPTAGVDANGHVYVFWEGSKGTLWETSGVNGTWSREEQITTAGNTVAAPPAVAVHANGELDVFWKGTDGALHETSRMS